MASAPPRRQPGYDCRIDDIAKIGKVSREAVIHAAKLHNHRVVGHAVWFSNPASVPFCDEMLRVQKMINARNQRREDSAQR